MTGEALSEELEGALMDAMDSAAWGPALSGRLKTVARSILLRHGLGEARVVVGMGPRGVEVHVQLPPGRARVETLVVSLG
jgi:hypothetical protein